MSRGSSKQDCVTVSALSFCLSDAPYCYVPIEGLCSGSTCGILISARTETKLCPDPGVSFGRSPVAITLALANPGR